MQLLSAARKGGTPVAAASGGKCAAALMDTLPVVMTQVRTYMRLHREGLSLPQFRALLHVNHWHEATVSSVAEHLGVSVPTASRVISGLVRRGLFGRAEGVTDRRRQTITLTDTGKSLLAGARRASTRGLETHFAGMTAAERAAVLVAMHALRRVFDLGTKGSDGRANGQARVS